MLYLDWKCTWIKIITLKDKDKAINNVDLSPREGLKAVFKAPNRSTTFNI